MQVFLPMVKADAERRLIFARAVHEVPDRSGEIFDYASSKPNIQAWSDAVAKDSNGLSKGNVRVMHTKVVAGKVTDLTFNDDDKAVDVVIKVVDDNEWRKVEEGLYTGVSIGGSYGNKWQDNGMTRYTAKPTEISLVDRPCIPTAVFFDLQKADGAVERVLFKAALPPSFADVWAARLVGFAELWKSKSEPVAGPMTFGELMKFDESKHPRDHGRFAVAATVAAAPVAVIGANVGRYVGGVVGAKAARHVVSERRANMRQIFLDEDPQGIARKLQRLRTQRLVGEAVQAGYTFGRKAGAIVGGLGLGALALDGLYHLKAQGDARRHRMREIKNRRKLKFSSTSGQLATLAREKAAS